ncbi:MAG: phosphonate ABC transporter, permease protein PhnE [Chloroflexi bacterium]|nr:phosphonate ABC transporter, permease protein PhnE [Chloroflexota bacterium]
MSNLNDDDNIEQPKPSLVPPFLAAFVSLIIPGLGQILARAVSRGLLIFFGMGTILGLAVWRFILAAPRDKGALAIFKKALRLEPFLILITLIILILYIWIARDAYFAAMQIGSKPFGLSLLFLVVFFALGWQVSEINPVTILTQADDAWPALSKVIWPWERAIEYPEEFISGGANIRVPCTDEALAPTEPVDEAPYVISFPTCGELTAQDGTPGTNLTIIGYNFISGVEAGIRWTDPNLQTFRHRLEGDFVIVTPDENGEFQIDVIMPYRLLPPSRAEGDMIWEISAQQVSSVGKPQASQELKLAIEKIIETIFIGMMATFFGIILAVPVSFLAARNLMSGSQVTVSIYYFTRTIMNIVRSIEPLIWAIIFVIAVGLGPFAGTLALTAHSVAALGKLYSESIESIERGPIEAIEATGANWLQTVVFAVIPQIIPPFVSFTIYRWDINVRMSTIIGAVGGGGIGFLLIQWIRLTDYRAAGIAVWFIAITVAALDFFSAKIRERFV